jgi:CMP-N,N'-diacetyllegionaminic acid synthase
MRTLGLVPARGGSRRVPGKNLARLEGKTLVRRALETAVAASCFDLVVLSSDDEEILAEATGLEVVVLRRPAELATDDARIRDVVAHALAAVEDLDSPFDAVGIVQATSPFTAPEDVAGTVKLLAETTADAAFSVARLEAAQHPLKLKRLVGDRLLPYLSDDRLRPSQALPPVWVRNGSVYVFRRAAVDEGLEANDARGYVMPPERSLDIDTWRDLEFAKFLSRPKPVNHGRFGSTTAKR